MKLCDERALKQMNQLVFKLFLPCTLFNNILSTDLKTVLQPQLLIYSAVCVLAACAAGWLIMPRITSDPRKQGVMIMNTYRSNAVLFGMPDCAADLWGFPARRDVDVDRSDCSFV